MSGEVYDENGRVLRVDGRVTSHNGMTGVVADVDVFDRDAPRGTVAGMVDVDWDAAGLDALDIWSTGGELVCFDAIVRERTHAPQNSVQRCILVVKEPSRRGQQ